MINSENIIYSNRNKDFKLKVLIILALGIWTSIVWLTKDIWVNRLGEINLVPLQDDFDIIG